MGEKTSIAWCHHTFNPWIGCAKVSPECDHCYAESGSKRLGAQHGLKLWDGDRYFTGAEYWKQPLRWNRAAEKAGERRRVFCASFSDVFEDRPELEAPRARLLPLIESTKWLDWLLLTKRPENMVPMTKSYWPDLWPFNVWAGTTVGVLSSIDRAFEVAKVPAIVRFLSMEPLLEPVDIDRVGPRLLSEVGHDNRGINWVIVGGESGTKARPFDLRWARGIKDACASTRVPFFMKQLGSRAFSSGMSAVAIETKHPKGEDPSEWPADLRVQQFPAHSIEFNANGMRGVTVLHNESTIRVSGPII